MTQTVPATAVLGPGQTGLAIGVTVLNIDGTTYAAFSTTGIAETTVLGTYRKAGGVVVPDAGGYLVWGVSGTAKAEATVDPKPAIAGDQMDLVNAPNATAVTAIQAGLATPTNITAGTITTVTNLTNLPAAAALEATLTTMKGATFSGATDSLEALRNQIDLMSGAAGSGAISWPITVNDGVNPIDGVEVWISTDLAGTSIEAGTLTTDAMGLVTFTLDAGTYYVWMQRSGYNFTNPTAITVA